MIPLNQASQSADPLFMVAVFTAGVLSFFSPCTFPMLPVYFGILTETARTQKKAFALLKTLLFVLGLSTTFLTLGLGAGTLGRYLRADGLTVIGGIIVILLGLHQMEVLKLPGLSVYKNLKFKANGKAEWLTAYVLGLTFSFGWTPCVGPVLGAVLVVASQGQQPLYGGFLMFLYTLGLGLPFFVIALLSNTLVHRLEGLEPYLPRLKKAGGALIVLMGLVLLFGQLETLTKIANQLWG